MTLTRAEALAACPFCSNKATHCVTPTYVRCMTCDASSPICETKQAAAEAWNRRAHQGRRVNPHEKLLDDCAYEIVKALVRGVPVREAMGTVFNLMLAYFKNLEQKK